MRYTLTDQAVTRLSEMSAQLHGITFPGNRDGLHPDSESPNAMPYPFTASSWFESGSWWVAITHGRAWDSSDVAGQVHIQKQGDSVSHIDITTSGFLTDSGESIYCEIWYPTGGGASGRLMQTSGAWPDLVADSGSGVYYNWPIASVDSGDGTVMQRHIGDIALVLSTGGGGGGGGTPVEITSYEDYNHYKCSVYGNGYVDDYGSPVSATETGIDLWILQIGATEAVPTGTLLMASKYGNHYEADVARDYG